LAASRSAASRRLMGRSADRDHNPNHQSAPRNVVRALQHRSYLALAVSYLALVIGIIIRIIRVLETRCEPRCTAISGSYRTHTATDRETLWVFDSLCLAFCDVAVAERAVHPKGIVGNDSQ
jgi:hypothetical protein